MSLDPRARRLLDMLAASAPGAGLACESPQQRRLGLRRLSELAADPAPSAGVEALSCPGQDGSRIPLRRYLPAESEGGAIVYVHGGGWVAGDLDTHDSVCRALAGSSRCVVFAVDYRQPPEHPFPAAIIDVFTALTWVYAHADDLGVDRAKLAVAGDSAGGNIAAAACLMARDAGAPPIALQLLICPILEIAPSTASRRQFRDGFFLDPARFDQDVADYAPAGTALDQPWLSPLRAPDLTGLPAAHIHVAGCDPFRDEGLAYAEQLRQVGTPCRTQLHAGMIHYFYALPRMIPYALTALDEIGAGVRETLAEIKA